MKVVQIFQSFMQLKKCNILIKAKLSKSETLPVRKFAALKSLHIRTKILDIRSKCSHRMKIYMPTALQMFEDCSSSEKTLKGNSAYLMTELHGKN